MMPQLPVVRIAGVKASDVAVLLDTVLTFTVLPGIGSRLTVRIVPQFALLVPGLQGEEVVLGGDSFGLDLEKAFSYDGEYLSQAFAACLPSAWFVC
jgi:hypothetical protein